MLAIIFDTETTGLPKARNKSIRDDANWPHIVQLAWMLYDVSDNKLISVNNYIIKLRDGRIIPQESINIHKITNEIMMEKGVDILVAFKEFFIDFDKASYVVAHNLNFDWQTMMKVELYRNKIYNRINLIKQKKIGYCTMKYGKDLYKFRDRRGKLTHKYPKLKDLYTLLYREEIDNFHNALVDTIVCFRCFYKMLVGSKPPASPELERLLI
jgi:DNA polymerase III epsilon subunit-like protein